MFREILYTSEKTLLPSPSTNDRYLVPFIIRGREGEGGGREGGKDGG